MINETFLINISLTQNSKQVHGVINKLIPLSVSSILRIAKNHKVAVKYDAEYIGIDDFSFKKGITFGSIICDLKTGKPIDVINSRNLDDVTKHFKLYTNAKVVSRDRSTTYAKAIKDALPNATQVADSFENYTFYLSYKGNQMEVFVMYGQGSYFSVNVATEEYKQELTLDLENIA